VLRWGSRVGITHAHIEQVEGFFARYGGAVVLFARFVVPLRQLNGIVAGILGMNWWRFLAFNSAGAALWVAFWSLTAYWFGRQLIALVHHLEPMAAVFVGVAVVVLVFAWWMLRRSTRNGRVRSRR
jgi:membrane protein DedA with SNARE-associated domain